MWKRCIVLFLGLFWMNCTFSVQAETVNKVLMVEQAKAKAPSLKAYMTGTGMSSDVSVSGMINDVVFSQEGDIIKFSDSGEALRIIVLFDNSCSVNYAQFEEAKNQLKAIRQQMGGQDELQIYTVGTLDVASDKVEILNTASPDEGGIEEDLVKIDEIAYLNDSNGKTILYRSLNQILELYSPECSIDDMRTVVLLVTDGEDDSDDVNGKDNDKENTLKNVTEASIPVYGVLLNNIAINANTEKIKFTKNKILNAEHSHGYYCNCSTETDGECVIEAFQKIQSILREETFIVVLGTKNNRTVGKADVVLTVDNQSVAPRRLDYSDREEDVEAPVFSGKIKKEGKNAILFSIKDENGVNIPDVREQTHFSIRTDEEDGKEWKIDQINADEDGKKVTIKLTMKDDEFFNDDYVLTISGIRDMSQEENAMDHVEASFSVSDGLDKGKEARKKALQKYWWVFLLLIVVIIGVVIIYFIKKKTVSMVEKDVDPEEFNKSDIRLIRLTITDGYGYTRDVDWTVEGSVFVGRSDICNIHFDDDGLSKQHFVIGVTKMGCYIEDLNSTNGTFVNGVRMSNRRPLLDGDQITAGREKIVFHVLENKASPYDV